MARLLNTVVFLPTALRRGTLRNAIRFATCKRTDESIVQDRTDVKCLLPHGSAAFIPLRVNAGAFRCNSVKRKEHDSFTCNLGSPCKRSTAYLGRVIPTDNGCTQA